MKTKKSQSEIISTILLILIVLAAILIVWQVVNKFIEKPRITIEKETCLDQVDYANIGCNVSDKLYCVLNSTVFENNSLNYTYMCYPLSCYISNITKFPTKEVCTMDIVNGITIDEDSCEEISCAVAFDENDNKFYGYIPKENIKQRFLIEKCEDITPCRIEYDRQICDNPIKNYKCFDKYFITIQ